MSDFDLHCIKRRLDALSEQVNKAWSERAREMALEARKRNSMHNEEGDKDMKAGNTKGWSAHRAAAGNYRIAHEHYTNGNEKQGDKFFQAGEKAGAKAFKIPRGND